MSNPKDNSSSSAGEHGGKSVKGGGDPSNAPTPARKDIAAGTGKSVPGYQKTPGIADPGVPGSRTNPVEEGRDPAPANPPDAKGQPPALKGKLAKDHLEP